MPGRRIQSSGRPGPGSAPAISTRIRPDLAEAAGLPMFWVKLLVPAAMTIFGKATWWIPKWLDRILPDVDVEGTKLEGKQLH